MESLSHLYVMGSACVWFALAGVFSGFLSGLLGLGGAFVLVPSFLAIFGAYYDFDSKSTLQLTLGTTMACMVVNAVCATLAQNKKRSVAWSVLTSCWPLLCLGTAIGVFLTSYFPATLIQTAFGCQSLYCGSRMVLRKSPTGAIVGAPRGVSRGTIFLFSALCGVLGIGGTTLFVPYLMRSLGIDLKRAMGTVSALQIPVSLVGTASFVAAGLLLPGTWGAGSAGAVGFVFVPAWLLVSIFSPCFTSLGVTVAHRIAAPRLRIMFGAFASLVGLKMLHGALF